MAFVKVNKAKRQTGGVKARLTAVRYRVRRDKARGRLAVISIPAAAMRIAQLKAGDKVDILHDADQRLLQLARSSNGSGLTLVASTSDKSKGIKQGACAISYPTKGSGLPRIAGSGSNRYTDQPEWEADDGVLIFAYTEEML